MCTTHLSVMSGTSKQWVKTIANLNSSFSISIIVLSPSPCPYSKPHKGVSGSKNTAVAPKATALITSVPLRMPPDRKTSVST